EHCLHHLLHRALLVAAQPQSVLELEDVQRAWIAFLVGDEGQAEAPTIGDHLLELLLTLLDCKMRLTIAPTIVSVLGSRQRRRGENDPDHRPRLHPRPSALHPRSSRDARRPRRAPGRRPFADPRPYPRH